MAGTVRLDVDGAVATITNDNPDKHNAFDDAMDRRLFDVLAELGGRDDVRAVVWRATGPSWSSGRDTSAIGVTHSVPEHHRLMRGGHEGIQRLWDLDAPVIAALHGWCLGGSFQRALLCDLRICAPDTRFALPEVQRGVIPDTGGVSVLYQISGPGLVSDMVLTGRSLDAEEALAHGIVSRIVPRDELDDTARAMAEEIAAAAPAAVQTARRVIAHLSRPAIRASMEDELIYQTYVVQAGRGED